MKSLIEELRKYPDCEMMVELHEKLTAEIDAHLARIWSYCEFEEDVDGSFVAPFPEGPEVDEIVKIVPQLEDLAKEIKADAKVVIETMGVPRSIKALEMCLNASISEITKSEQDVFTAMKTCIKDGISPNDARDDPKVKATLHRRDIVMRTHQHRADDLMDRIDIIKSILRKYEEKELADLIDGEIVVR